VFLHAEERADFRVKKSDHIVDDSGSALGLRVFPTAIRLAGLRGAYGLLYLVGAWHALFDSAAVRDALAYLGRRFPGDDRLRQRWNVYRLFLARGRSLIDRCHLRNGGRFNYTRIGFEAVPPLLHEGRGLIVLSSHAGDWQASFVAIENWNKPLHVLLWRDEHPVPAEKTRITGGLSVPADVRVINAEGSLGGLLESMQALQEGGVVCIMGERNSDARKVAAKFLGQPAQFPCGAFLIAHAAQCPVAVLLSAKTGTRDYEFRIAGIIEPRPGESTVAFLERGVQGYATLLERHFEEHPYQCFLFRDIWNFQSPVTA